MYFLKTQPNKEMIPKHLNRENVLERDERSIVSQEKKTSYHFKARPEKDNQSSERDRKSPTALTFLSGQIPTAKIY